MPTYELAILYRVLPKDQLKEALKSTANLIFQEGGVIRKLNNLGLQSTPWRMRSHGQTSKQANYFIYEFDVPTTSVTKLKNELLKYESIVRHNVYPPAQPIKPSDCQIAEELQIAPFRKEVINMLKYAKKSKEALGKRKLKPNHGLDFDPFPL